MKDLRHHLRHIQKKIIKEARKEVIPPQNGYTNHNAENNVVNQSDFLTQNSPPFPPARRRW